ncbi:MAG: DNA-processing protein DprA [Acidobacteriota bacterium]|nr:DNA-processing protein DprA [Acidobacteriota bacterium]
MAHAAPRPAPSSSPSEQAKLWLALALTPTLGPSRARKLVEHFESVDNIFRASLTELEAAGLRAGAAQSIGTGKSLALAEEEMVRAAASGAHIIGLSDPAYPPLLKQIYDPPVVLFVRGDVETISRPGIAIVGTRHPTPYGIGMAERLACDLANRGLVIFSGMARGVDTAAHRGAFQAKGQTVAVFGTGVDVMYPRENKKIAEQMVALGGALVSEFPMATFAAPQNFPIRNRIISGLSLGVLVVEAGEYSGTRITARCALEQDRDLFAVPGNVTNKNSWGPNTLIKQGARLTATWEDVWEELPAEVQARLVPETASESKEPSTASLFEDDQALGAAERKIFALLKPDESTHIDELVEQLEPHVSSSEIFAALFELEMSGKIRQLPGKNFVKAF